MYALLSLLPAVTVFADLPDDSFGSAIIHRLGVPDWSFQDSDPLRLESGDVDDNPLIDFCALFAQEGQSLHQVVAFPDLGQVVEPWTLSTQATDFVILPAGPGGARGVMVATASGLEVFAGEDTLHVSAPIANSSSFAGCDQLQVTAVGSDVGVTAISPSGDLLSGVLSGGQLVSYAPQQHAGLNYATAVEWTPGVLGIAVLDGSSLRVVSAADGSELASALTGGGAATLRAQSSDRTPGGVAGRVLCSVLQGPYTILWSLEHGETPAYSVVSAGGRATADIDFADIDLDGTDDLVLTIANFPEAWILYGDSSGENGVPFYIDLENSSRALLALTGSPVSDGCMALGDVDGDLDIDLTRAEIDDAPQLVVRENRRHRVNDFKVTMQLGTDEVMSDSGSIRDVTFQWEDKLWTPAGTGGASTSVLENATGIRIDIFLQETPTSTFNRTPWYTHTLPIPFGGGLTGIKVEGTVTAAQENAIFRCRLQHVSGTQAIGPATHFIHSFEEPVNNLVNDETIWSEYVFGEQSGTQRAGEYKPRGGTTPPIPPPN